MRATGDLRDLAVEQDGLRSVVRRDSKIAAGLVRDFRRQHDREARKLARSLESLRLGKAQRRLRALARDLRKDKKNGPRTAAKTLVRAIDEVRSARRSVAPTDPKSIHALQVGLKRFRYVLELFEPVFPSVRGGRASSVKSLQRTMGDIRDNETLAGSLSARARGEPRLLPDAAGVLGRLEERHSGMMRSFLKSVDAILRFWEARVGSLRQDLEHRAGAES